MVDRKLINEIIDFAIEREEEAILFYQELQLMTNFENQKKLFHNFELMEKGHIETLKRIRKTDISEIMIPEINNLKISDYIVQLPITENLSYQDIIIIAMKREEASYNLYLTMSNNTNDTEIKALFSRLATEEAKHKLLFEEIYDKDVLKDN